MTRYLDIADFNDALGDIAEFTTVLLSYHEPLHYDASRCEGDHGELGSDWPCCEARAAQDILQRIGQLRQSVHNGDSDPPVDTAISLLP